MSDQADVVKKLIARVRAGEDGSLAELMDRFELELRDTAERAIGSSPSDETVQQALQVTRSEAVRRFSEFDGSDETGLRSWLVGILQDSLKLATGNNGAQGNDSSSDATLKMPAKSTVVEDVAAHKGETLDETLDTRTDGINADDTLQRPVEDLLADRGRAATESTPTPKRFGEYEIIDTIAQGGMGIVYKARQGKLNRTVALKMILAGQFADKEHVDRFYIEAEAAARLRHPNIVAIHEVSECDGQHYYSMDFIEGQSLADIVRENPLSPRDAAQYAQIIAEAMQHAHAEGILHRDLKPSNVLVDRTNEPMITDFGLAKHTESQSQLTVTGTIMGTPSYMPPEQASGKVDQITACSDIYSIGAILYELLTGRPPFSAANPFETVKQVLETDPAPPRTLNPAVPADLETICLNCLQKEPRSAPNGGLRCSEKNHRSA